MPTSANRLLAALPRDVHERLSGVMQIVDLSNGEVVQRPATAIERVYFPLDCLISVTVTMANGNVTEAGIVGNREMVGLNAFMGGRESTQTEYVAQVPGRAVVMPAGPLLTEFDCHKGVRDLMLRFTQAYVAQLSQNVACNRQHDIRQRLARWLLECRDRIHSGQFCLTHEFLSQMLGVRRSGISEAASELQGRGVIEYGQKDIRIIDSAALASAACECYDVLRTEYARLLEPYKANVA
jgi:CRP-like cAMP-binding protein